MKSLTLATLLVVTVPLFLQSSEPSAFGAGDVNSKNPYGLTRTEQVLLDNKNNLLKNQTTLHKVKVNSNNQANKVDALRERLDGLQSILESISRKSQANKVELQKLNNKNVKELKNSNEYEVRLVTVTQTNTENIQKNREDVEKLKLVINELSSIIESINSNYITRDEFNKIITDVNNFKELMIAELKKSRVVKKKSVKSAFTKMSNGDVATKAKDLFSKHLYTKAIEHYEYLIEKNYRPANSHYMIGEMYYKRKNYANAISYFKKSASLYSKASYMPNLMLHTAISMDKTGDKNNAKSFYDAVISKYPSSKESKEARKYRNLIN